MDTANLICIRIKKCTEITAGVIQYYSIKKHIVLIILYYIIVIN